MSDIIPLDQVVDDTASSSMPDVIPLHMVQEDATSKPLTAGETFAGGMSDLLSKLTLGAGDEIVAGGKTAIDDVWGGLKGLFNADTPTQSYDQNLAQVRGLIKGYQEEHPIASAANYAAGILTPAPKLLGATKAGGSAPSLFTTVAKGTGVGAGYGAAGGFLSGEGAGDRLSNAITGAEIGGALGGTIPLVASGVSSAAKGIANSLDDAASATREKGLGIQYGDRARGLKALPTYLDEAGNVVDRADATTAEAPIEHQVSLLAKTGILDDAPNNPRELKVFLGQKTGEAGDRLQTLIGDANKVLGSDPIPVQYNETGKFFSNLANRNPTKAKELIKDFEEVAANYENAGTFLNPITGETQANQIGALSRINSVKSGLNDKIKLWQKEADTPKVEFYRAVYRDLQALENSAFNAALPDKANEFQAAKDVYGALSGVNTTINKAGARKGATLLNSLEGGSKPAAVMAGVASPLIGLPGGLSLSASTLLGKAALNVAENNYPLSTANAYESLGRGLRGIASAAETSRAIPSLTAAATSSGSAPGPAKDLPIADLPTSQRNQSDPVNYPSASSAASPRGAGMLVSGYSPAQFAKAQQATEQGAGSDIGLAKISYSNSQPPKILDQALNGIMGDRMNEKPTVVDEYRAPIFDVSYDTSGAARLPGAQYIDTALKVLPGLVKQESGGKVDVVSHKGAVGLGQLMPATGREWHDKLGIVGDYNPRDPEQNKLIATHYLAYLMDMYDGNLPLALTAYNQGFANVNKALAVSGGTTLEEALSALNAKGRPIIGPDGQKYAAKVLKNLGRNDQVLA